MSQFRKKPALIEAIQYDGSNREALFEWMGVRHDKALWESADKSRMWCSTANGDIVVHVGDWVCAQQLASGRMDVWPVAPDIFAETYEPAPRAPEVVAPPLTQGEAWNAELLAEWNALREAVLRWRREWKAIPVGGDAGTHAIETLSSMWLSIQSTLDRIEAGVAGATEPTRGVTARVLELLRLAHNHGAEDGPSFNCPEYRIGLCVKDEIRRLVAELEMSLHDEGADAPRCQACGSKNTSLACHDCGNTGAASPVPSDTPDAERLDWLEAQGAIITLVLFGVLEWQHKAPPISLRAAIDETRAMSSGQRSPSGGGE